MDLTYFVAAFLALAIGFVAALVVIFGKAASAMRPFVAAILISIASHFLLLLDWSQADKMSAEFLLTDGAAFLVASAIGCGLGFWPVVGLQRLSRRIDD
jgi:hypothetical protein